MSLPALIDFLNRLEDNESGDINAGDMRFIITSLYEEFERLDQVFNLTLLADGTRVLDPEYIPTGPKSIVDIEYLKPFEESLSTALQTTGGTMTGILYLIPELPETFTEAAHKGYVDFAIAEYAASLIASQRFIEAAGDTMLGPLLLNGSITQANQAVTKQYSDTAISVLDAQLKTYVRNYIKTDTTNTPLFSANTDNVKIRGLKASQNVTLEDDGTDITIKANVAGTGGDVRTDVSNIYDEGTTQNFDNVSATDITAENYFGDNVSVNTVFAQTVDAPRINISGVSVEETLSQTTDTANNANTLANTANNTANNALSKANTADSKATAAKTAADAAQATANDKISMAGADKRYLRSQPGGNSVVNFQLTGTAFPIGMPDAWTAERLETGIFKVTVDINQNLYPVITVDSATQDDSYNVHVFGGGVNWFQYVIRNRGGAPVNLGHNIMLCCETNSFTKSTKDL